MKLVHPDFPCKIEFEENKIQTLVIENPRIVSRYLSELFHQVNGKEGSWVLSEKGEIYSLQKKCQIIIDPFSLDFNQKKMVHTLYEEIEKETISTELLLEWSKLYPVMMNTLEEMIAGVEYDLSYDEGVEIKDFLKIMNLRFNEGEGSLAERLMDYICLTHEVLGTALFILVNIKMYLDEKELKFLFEQTFYKKISILLLENCVSEQKYMEEKVIVIDKDSCVILQNVE